jgi:hypothetical protein
VIRPTGTHRTDPIPGLGHRLTADGISSLPPHAPHLGSNVDANFSVER